MKWTDVTILNNFFGHVKYLLTIFGSNQGAKQDMHIQGCPLPSRLKGLESVVSSPSPRRKLVLPRDATQSAVMPQHVVRPSVRSVGPSVTFKYCEEFQPM